MQKIIEEDGRVLTEVELINLNNKKNTLPVEYFRKNLFNATTRTSKELKRLKTIFDDGKNKIQVNRSLHQKHRDLLSIIFTDSKEIRTSPDGSMQIYTSLYYLAKAMQYKNPKDAKHLVKDFLWDLENTKFIFTQKKNVANHYIEQSHDLIGNHFYDSEEDFYIINIPAKTNKFKILSFAVEIPKEINRKIISIPNSLAKTKALISYILANKALKNGVTLENICDKLDIIKENKSRFKKELKENTKLLTEFNIVFDEETNIIKYEQIDDIKFHRAVKPQEILEIIEEKQIDPKEQELEELINLFQSKFLKAPAKMGGGFVTHKIIEVQQEEQDSSKYRFYLGENTKKERMHTPWNTKDYFIKLLEQDWIVDKEIY